MTTKYERGWFDAMKRVWDLITSLELKYETDAAKKDVLAELAVLVMQNEVPPKCS